MTTLTLGSVRTRLPRTTSRSPTSGSSISLLLTGPAIGGCSYESRHTIDAALDECEARFLAHRPRVRHLRRRSYIVTDDEPCAPTSPIATGLPYDRRSMGKFTSCAVILGL